MKMTRYLSFEGSSYRSWETILKAFPLIPGSQETSSLIVLTRSNS